MKPAAKRLLPVLAMGIVPLGMAASDSAPMRAAAPVATAATAGLINERLRAYSSQYTPWDLGGQFRVRYEAKENAGSYPNRDFARDLDNSNEFMLFRAKVHVGWTPASWLNAFIEGRDSRVASDPRPLTEADTMDLHQAYLHLGDPAQFPLVLKIGRQEMVYGDQRYIGNADWSNVQRSFDAAKLRFESGALWVDVFTGHQVIPWNGHFNESNEHDWFSGIYGSSRRLAHRQETEFYILARNVGARSPAAITPTLGGPGERDIYTLGTRWKSLPSTMGAWDYAFEAAWQFGNIVQASRRLDHRALAVNATGGYTWKNTRGSPRLGLGYDYGSGDGDPLDDTNRTFESLFGTNHRLYGNMDLTGLRNMHIPRLEGSFMVMPGITLSIEWLAYWLAETADFFYPESGPGRNQNGYGRNPGYSSSIGQEVDVLLDWRFSGWGLLRLGYGHFFEGDYIRQSIESVPSNGGAVGANWLYAQATVNF